MEFNNPGNIRPKNGLYQGQIGVGDTASGKFAIFGSYEEGRNEKEHYFVGNTIIIL